MPQQEKQEVVEKNRIVEEREGEREREDMVTGRRRAAMPVCCLQSFLLRARMARQCY